MVQTRRDQPILEARWYGSQNYKEIYAAEVERIVSTSIIRKKNGVVVPLVMLFGMWDDGNGTKNRGRLRDSGCLISPKMNGHKWEALYMLLGC